MDKLERAIGSGLDYLASQQQADGSFASLSSPVARPFRAAKTYQTTFAPALILSALGASKLAASLPVRDRLTGWLIKQASPQWSFNYWAVGSPERKRQAYPDDLDDTFCALSALYAHDPALIDGKVLAHAVKLLLATESTLGGPYRTWLVPKNAEQTWQDVDLAVNANVTYFLSLVAEPLPTLTAFIDTAIANNNLSSPYYPSAYPVLYYIARQYHGAQRPALVKLARAMLSAADSALDSALCASALVRLGGDIRQNDIDKLLGYQLPNGGWPAAAFCLDPAIGDRAHYSGSAALTTAFAIEALALWLESRQDSSQQVPSRRPASKNVAGQYEAVMRLVHRQCESLPAELQAITLRTIQTIAGGSNGGEIIELAARFNESLVTPLSGPSANQLLTRLGAANLYGWTAYTIYDDFLDGEGKPELLSTANTALRYSLTNWQAAMAGDRAFAAFVARTFDAIDGANAWEQAHCRFGVEGNLITIGELSDYADLAKLAERSLGHSLGPVAVLVRAGAGVNSRSVKQLQKTFKHYLIARQLNDDCHDWADDLRGGQITYVVSRLLAELRVQPGSRALAPLQRRARHRFWHTTLPSLCQEMLQHVQLARAAIKDIKELSPPNTLTDLLDQLEASIAKTLTEREQSIEFLQHYSVTTR